jgi:uncharacterized protein (TIGR02996 family)
MSDGAGLLRNILENPDDDTPRLIYADWLQDNGDPLHSELIRAQVGLARLVGTDEYPGDTGLEAGRLLPAYRARLLAPYVALGLAPCCNRYHDGPFEGFDFFFRRGFVEDIDVYGAGAGGRLVAVAARLFAMTPLRHLRFRPTDVEAGPLVSVATITALLRCPEVRRLRSLEVPAGRFARALRASPHLSPNTTVRVRGSLYGARDIRLGGGGPDDIPF